MRSYRSSCSPALSVEPDLAAGRRCDLAPPEHRPRAGGKIRPWCRLRGIDRRGETCDGLSPAGDLHDLARFHTLKDSTDVLLQLPNAHLLHALHFARHRGFGNREAEEAHNGLQGGIAPELGRAPDSLLLQGRSPAPATSSTTTTSTTEPSGSCGGSRDGSEWVRRLGSHVGRPCRPLLPPEPKAASTAGFSRRQRSVSCEPSLPRCSWRSPSPPAARAADVKLETEDQKTLYALGLALSRNLAHLQPDADELATVEAGIADGLFAKEKKVDLEKYDAEDPGARRRPAPRSSAEKEKEAAKPFLDKMAEEKGAKKPALRRHLHRGEGGHAATRPSRPTR